MSLKKIGVTSGFALYLHQLELYKKMNDMKEKGQIILEMGAQGGKSKFLEILKKDLEAEGKIVKYSNELFTPSNPILSGWKEPENIYIPMVQYVEKKSKITKEMFKQLLDRNYKLRKPYKYGTTRTPFRRKLRLKRSQKQRAQDYFKRKRNNLKPRTGRVSRQSRKIL